MARARSSAGAGAPAARRVEVRRWRDPRLLGGVVLVLGATTLGARVLAQADDTVAYWAVADDVRAGDPVQRDDLVATHVQLGGDVAGAYVRVDDELPAALDDLRWSSDLGPGALVAPNSWQAEEPTRGHLPVSVQTGSFPADLAVGDLVDVWVGPGPGESVEAPAERVATGLRVVQAGESETLGASVTRAIVLDLGQETLAGDQVAAVAAGHVTLVRVP
ncbi:hypothetical protein [Aeromicrobium alkaliterrae]|uniref:SAF domain-containing protein n=1 Tax=Aeromicrobium alkaliterrae TaxID=302168 RepID=A0ABP4VVH2_9ACTN